MPMKFTLDGATGHGVLFGYPRSRQVDCTTGAPLGNWAPTEAGCGLAVRPAGVYTYDWKT